MTSPRSTPVAHSDPDDVRLITEDVERFWQAFDRARPEFDPLVLDRFYLRKASPGLRDFLGRRLHGPGQLSKALQDAPRFYESIRDSTRRICDMEPQIREVFRALKRLYPEALFPPVYFVVGRLNCGGARTERGIIIGAEMYARTPDTPTEELRDWLLQVLQPVDAVPHAVAHELVHFQQKRAREEPLTLLFAALREGAADFLAEKISGRHVNEPVYEWARSRERELWREFRQKMGARDYSDWLYGGDFDDGRPADLGYWMGYRIVDAYWRRAQDERRAVREILHLEEAGAEEFLESSGYAGGSRPRPRRRTRP